MVTPMRCIFDTGAGPNIVHLRVLPDNWESYRIADAPPVNLMGTGGRRLHQRGTVNLHVEIGRLSVRAQFLVVQNLAADCILGCQFIDRQVQAILPKEKQIRLIDGSSIPILHDVDPLVPCPEPSVPPVVVSTKVRVARFITIPAHAEVPVQVQCAAPGVRFLQAYHRPHDHTGVSLANVVADIIPLEQFTVRVLNDSGHSRVLSKGMVLGHALPHPNRSYRWWTWRRDPLTCQALMGPNGKQMSISITLIRHYGRRFWECSKHTDSYGTGDLAAYRQRPIILTWYRRLFRCISNRTAQDPVPGRRNQPKCGVCSTRASLNPPLLNRLARWYSYPSPMDHYGSAWITVG
jgi:hypothetical protein